MDALQRRPALVIVALVIAILLAACGAGAGAAPPGRDAGGHTAASAAAEDAEGRGNPDPADPQSYANLADRQIVKTGEITLEVASVATSVGAVRALALDLGGYVGGSRAGNAEEAASLTLRIPADRFDDAIEALHAMDAELVAEATREEDVTGAVVDLEARIRNLAASETQYRALLDRATEIEDILTVQSRLDEVRGRIEQLQAQLDQLSAQAALATLTVTLVPAAAPVEAATEGWDAGAIFESAVAALVGVGQAVATVAIWLAIVGLPLAVLTGIVLAVALRAAPAFRRRPVAPSE